MSCITDDIPAQLTLTSRRQLRLDSPATHEQGWFSISTSACNIYNPNASSCLTGVRTLYQNKDGQERGFGRSSYSSPLKAVSWEPLLAEISKEKRKAWTDIDFWSLIEESTSSGPGKSMISLSAKILSRTELRASHFAEHPRGLVSSFRSNSQLLACVRKV